MAFPASRSQAKRNRYSRYLGLSHEVGTCAFVVIAGGGSNLWQGTETGRGSLTSFSQFLGQSHDVGSMGFRQRYDASEHEVGTCAFSTAPAVYANGYVKRARIRVPASSIQFTGSLPFVMLFDETEPFMKDVVHSGYVQSSSGWDIRFELADGTNTKLPHIIESYDPVTGKLVAWVRWPALAAGQNNDLYIYIGKSGLLVTEEDRAGAGVDFLQWLNALTGEDMSGHSRSVIATTPLPQPSAYVKVAATIGLTRSAANIIVPTIDAAAANFITVAANQTSDARDKVVSNHQKPPGKFSPYRPRGCGDQAVLTGFKAVGLQPDTLVWRQMKHDLSPYTTGDYDDNGCLSETQAGTLIYENFYLDNQMDGINTPTDNNNRPVTVRGGYARRIRDDFIENDSLQTLLVEDVLVDSCHMFISQRPGGSGGGSTAHVTTIRNCLVRMRGQAYDTDVGGDAQEAGSKRSAQYPAGSVVSPTGTAAGFSHGWFFKTADNCMNIAISDCILMLESIPTGGDNLAVWPPGTYSNVALIWLGPGSYASNCANALPSGVTVTTDIALWNTERANWITAHGGSPTADDFPFLHV